MPIPKTFIALLVFMLLTGFTSFCQEDSTAVVDTTAMVEDTLTELPGKRFFITGYLKNLSSVQIPAWKGDWVFDNLIHNRINLKWYAKRNIVLRLESRTRLFIGESIKNNSYYVEQLNRSLDYLKLGGQVAKGRFYLLNNFIDRANVDWNVGKWQVIAGKQRINWSKSFVWNPNDIFNAYSFFDFDYEERRGTDAVLVKYNLSSSSAIEAAGIIESSFAKTTMAAKLNFQKWNYDFQTLLGKYGEEAVIGTGWAGQIRQVGFKGEITYFLPYSNDTTKNTFLADASFDYTFPNTLNFRLEGIYNSPPVRLQGIAFFFQPVTAKTLTFNHWSLFASTGYDITPLIKANMSSIWYIDDRSFFLNPTLNISLNENTDLLLAAQVFAGRSNSIFGNLGSYVFTRLKWSF